MSGSPVKNSEKAALEMEAVPATIKNPERLMRRRAELIEVATRLFLENGFHNTSIREIVRACSFNLASLYMYVSSKEDILFLVAQDLMSNIAEELANTKLSSSSPRKSLELGFSSYCYIVDKWRRQIRLLYREVGRLPPEMRSRVLGTVADVVSFFETIVEDGIKQQVFRKVPARVTALQIMFNAHAIALHTREIKEVVALDDYVKYQMRVMLSGLLVNT
ncbi:TetR/AcrR family transcriptional regulator [Mesorhizobium sp.]|uniref:TetR/AcrR family transcriptional regulator n=1 Tax=Mesorhizobium sp. TaxID=1871066 RepID=UPI0025EECC82|nr:TetR/AcrR family transcriptional regulator [Mesorhizobium sp.]